MTERDGELKEDASPVRKRRARHSHCRVEKMFTHTHTHIEKQSYSDSYDRIDCLT